jgi:hypothetical protein
MTLQIISCVQSKNQVEFIKFIAWIINFADNSNLLDVLISWEALNYKSNQKIIECKKYLGYEELFFIIIKLNMLILNFFILIFCLAQI